MAADPRPRPPLTGLRPLGPYGEGYCRVCHFVEPLLESGAIAPHTRGSMIAPRECKGSYTRPPKVTPYASRLAAFRQKGKKVDCPLCKRQVWLMPDDRLPAHTTAIHTTTLCNASHRPLAFYRDHAGERGEAA
jgi:hypothetical protein